MEDPDPTATLKAMKEQGDTHWDVRTCLRTNSEVHNAQQEPSSWISTLHKCVIARFRFSDATIETEFAHFMFRDHRPLAALCTALPLVSLVLCALDGSQCHIGAVPVSGVFFLLGLALVFLTSPGPNPQQAAVGTTPPPHWSRSYGCIPQIVPCITTRCLIHEVAATAYFTCAFWRWSHVAVALVVTDGGSPMLATVAVNMFLTLLSGLPPFAPRLPFSLTPMIGLILGVVTGQAGGRDSNTPSRAGDFSYKFGLSRIVLMIVAIVLGHCVVLLMRERLLRRIFALQIQSKDKLEEAEVSTNEVSWVLTWLLPRSVLHRATLLLSENNTGAELAAEEDADALFAFAKMAGIVVDSNEGSALQSDLCGFTGWCSSRNAVEVVAMLSIFVDAIDSLALKSDVLRIRTIGDAYLAVTGLPGKCSDHAAKLVQFGLEMHTTLKRCCQEHPNWGHLQMRIGVDSGMLIGAVLSRERWSYDVYGKVPGRACRLEQHGRPDCVMISRATFNQLPATDPLRRRCIRGEKVDLGNKGRLRSTWRLESTLGAEGGVFRSGSGGPAPSPKPEPAESFALASNIIKLNDLHKQETLMRKQESEAVVETIKKRRASQHASRTGSAEFPEFLSSGDFLSSEDSTVGVVLDSIVKGNLVASTTSRVGFVSVKSLSPGASLGGGGSGQARELPTFLKTGAFASNSMQRLGLVVGGGGAWGSSSRAERGLIVSNGSGHGIRLPRSANGSAGSSAHKMGFPHFGSARPPPADSPSSTIVTSLSDESGHQRQEEESGSAHLANAAVFDDKFTTSAFFSSFRAELNPALLTAAGVSFLAASIQAYVAIAQYGSFAWSTRHPRETSGILVAYWIFATCNLIGFTSIAVSRFSGWNQLQFVWAASTFTIVIVFTLLDLGSQVVFDQRFPRQPSQVLGPTPVGIAALCALVPLPLPWWLHTSSFVLIVGLSIWFVSLQEMATFPILVTLLGAAAILLSTGIHLSSRVRGLQSMLIRHEALLLAQDSQKQQLDTLLSLKLPPHAVSGLLLTRHQDDAGGRDLHWNLEDVIVAFCKFEYRGTPGVPTTRRDQGESPIALPGIGGSSSRLKSGSGSGASVGGGLGTSIRDLSCDDDLSETDDEDEVAPATRPKRDPHSFDTHFIPTLLSSYKQISDIVDDLLPAANADPRYPDLSKIKTLGDIIIVAGSVVPPQADATEAPDPVDLCLQMMQFLKVLEVATEDVWWGSRQEEQQLTPAQEEAAKSQNVPDPTDVDDGADLVTILNWADGKDEEELPTSQQEHKEKHKEKPPTNRNPANLSSFTMSLRTGLSFGPVTTAIVGQQQLEYDIYGTTVNTASRVLSSFSSGDAQLAASVAMDQVASPVVEADVDPTTAKNHGCGSSVTTLMAGLNNNSISISSFPSTMDPSSYPSAAQEKVARFRCTEAVHSILRENSDRFDPLLRFVSPQASDDANASQSTSSGMPHLPNASQSTASVQFEAKGLGVLDLFEIQFHTLEALMLGSKPTST